MQRLLGLMLMALFTAPAAAEIEQWWKQALYSEGQSYSWASAIIADGNGNFIVAGYIARDSGAVELHTVKYRSPDGEPLWTVIEAGPEPGQDVSKYFAQAAMADSAGNIIVLVNVEPGGLLAIKYTAGGELIWKHLQPWFAGAPGALALDAGGNVFVTGTGFVQVYDSIDYYTAKYAAATGEVIWERFYNGPGNGDDYAMAIAVDLEGNAVVAGASSGGPPIFGNRDFHTIKYAATGGMVLWEQRFNGSGNRHDKAVAVAIDSVGDVFVTGTAFFESSGEDYLTIKYSGYNGVPLWQESYYSRLNLLPDTANDLALDGNGDVFVTGTSVRSHTPGYTNEDYYTIKYSGADGRILWQRDYNGPAGLEDTAAAIGVDAQGNVVVTGSSVGSSTRSDYLTISYTGSDGATLWDQRFNSAAGSVDIPAPNQSLALLPGGIVAVTGYSLIASTVGYGPDSSTPAGWRQRYFGQPENQGMAADGADPDEDGHANLVEYACGLNPLAFDLPVGTPAVSGENFTFTYPRSKAATGAGVVYEVEWSRSLVAENWSTVGVASESVDDGALIRHTAKIPLTMAPSFVRLRVTAPP